MTTHSILIGARGRGHIGTIEERALTREENYLVKNAVRSMEVKSSTTVFDFFEDGTLSSEPTVLLIEAIEDITNECVDELVEEFKAWTAANSELDLTVYWSLIGLAPYRVLELTEKLMPLVALG